MRGYPVGSFLLWDVKPETAQSYAFYEFLTHFQAWDLKRERPVEYTEKTMAPFTTRTGRLLSSFSTRGLLLSFT